MAIKVKCPTCGARLKAPEAAAGRPLDCPHCAQTVPVPARAAGDPRAGTPPPSVAGSGESLELLSAETVSIGRVGIDRYSVYPRL